jgi:2-polyprenyl-3-methyl-5-hydroxy-6-metoxy-1,4-benzoquinol methylase
VIKRDLNWREISNQPASIEIRKHLLAQLSEKIGDDIDDIFSLLRKISSGKRVLDVGGVGHNIESTSSPLWKHNVLRTSASYVLGIDILPNEVSKLNEIGYNFRLCDATSDTHLGEIFDIVFLGDVIEHVSNPVSLLAFARRHLDENGVIICTSPNPFYIGNFKTLLRNGAFISNAEHLFWISPCNAIEIGYRAKLLLEKYHKWHDKRSFWKRILNRFASALGHQNSEFLPRAYVYIYSPHKQETTH